ncbi:hypothetical protein [Blautia producta]|uniref:hypothetical protein n=1 Tax=Blautia producta TaxID=33035 RepID=UPI0031B61A1D
MDNVVGYEEYEEDYKTVVLPEYRWMAEQFLLEALENCDPAGRLEVSLPEGFSRDSCGYTFRFDIQTGGSGNTGGVLVIYTGFY